MNIKLSIIIPVYNEATTITHVLNDLRSELDGKMVYEIIVVNDGSTDASQSILEKIPFITLVTHKLNRGYGASLKDGISRAQFDWVLTFDADGSHLASQIKELLPHTEEYDLIIGSRDGKRGYDTFGRNFGRNIITTFAEYISQSKILDINSGFRLFKKSLAKKFWHLFPEKFSFSTTLTVAAHTHNYAVKYVPVEVHKRKGGSSGIKPAKDFVGFLNQITRLTIYFRPLRALAPLATIFFVSAIAVVVVEYLRTGGILNTTFAILMTTGVQIMVLGLIAEMIVKRFYSADND